MTKTQPSATASASGGPGQLRIIAGKWRRRLLPVAAVEGLRPTAERIRETLFNWLAPHIDGARCLDLCAGTGALGFEALSRGAASVTFVEQSHKALAGLRQSADLLDAAGATVEKADALRWLDRPATASFDIVFVDPPYAAGMVPDLCRLLHTRAWLASNALIYLEHDRREPPAAVPEGWQLLKDKTAGKVRYALLTTHAEN